ncbi:ATP-dependent DNA ligase [Streptomyces sp. NPDC057438]|uniref:ATP-dependent DNA ligase n=1 Tax=Streptomyces sp. NPDC057438 TaxID=3346133 RepID=UPI00368DE7FC
MALTPPIEPMLAATRRILPSEGGLPGGLVAEQKVDGFRALLFARPGHALIQSRRGSDLTGAFPDIAVAAANLGETLVLDGELVVPHEGRLDFPRLQSRASRRGAGAVRAAARHPAHLIVFDVLEASGDEQLARPYRERRAVLENLFAHGVLAAPFTLCPHTTDRTTARDWLDPVWGTAGIEGVVCKGLAQPYLPGRRAWIKVRARITAEAVIGAVTGSPTHPLTLVLGRYDGSGELRMVALTTPLDTEARQELGRRLTRAGSEHPWHGRHFRAGWGSRSQVEYCPVRPDMVAEFVADAAFDAGRYRHPVRFVRVRSDMSPRDVELLPGPDAPGTGDPDR